MANCRYVWVGALFLGALLGIWGASPAEGQAAPGRGGFGRRAHNIRPVDVDPDALASKAAALGDDRVRAAISKGADSLLDGLTREIKSFKESTARQNNGRGGVLIDDQLAGSICLSTYALLMAGRVTEDPRLHFTSKEMTEPVAFVTSLRSRYTYTLALQTSALSLLPNRPEFRRTLTAERNELLQGDAESSYTYYTNRPAPPGNAGPWPDDNSNTQYGQLGVWACQDAGLEVPLRFWEDVDAHWRRSQLADGGWAYTSTSGNGPSWWQGTTATMTAAGVASLFLAQDELDRTVNYNPRPDKALDAGIDWLATHFADFRSMLPGDLYLAYGIERVALSGGLKTLGTHDWYREGAALLLNEQAADGSWTYARGPPGCGTAYALLFLARGIAPVACGKLQYDGPWNARARDCARFVHWLSKRTEKTLNWQTLSIDSDPDDWNVPVLVITGHDDPKFTADQISRLRRYVLGGGLIFSSADEGSAAFTRAIKQKYAPAIFDDAYEMRALPADHPAFDLTFKIPKAGMPHLFGLSNGVRDVWIHSADDLAASWQAYSTSRSQNFEVPANIYFYALGRAPHGIHLAPLTPPPPPAAARTLNIARIMYAGNWDPEPAAWGRYADFARQNYAADIRIVPVKIADLDAAKTPIAHLTGTTAFVPTEAQRKKLGEFFAGGGVLLADAVGGNNVFATSFQAAVAQLFPAGALQDVPPDSPMLSGGLPGGAAISSPETRRFADLPENRRRPMWVMEVKANGRPVIVFSHADLTAGVGGIRTWGIFGYTPETTRALAWNTLMYLAPPKPAGTQAAPMQAASAPAPVSSAGSESAATNPAPH